jgi:hypothetical protein
LKSIHPKFQANKAIDRLTALWALSECGLGGVLHAFKMPFTGVFAGGMALILGSLLAYFFQSHLKKMMASLMVVLLIKATVSPHSPFPAYFAVGFQALMGMWVYRFLGIHFFSILLVCLLAMLESAFQKLLFLTLFLGESFWKSIDEWLAFVARQLGGQMEGGSFWLAGAYLGFYFLAGCLVAYLCHRLLTRIQTEKLPLGFLEKGKPTSEDLPAGNPKSSHSKWIWLLLFLLLSTSLWIWKPDGKSMVWEMAKSLLWTLSAIFLWFVILQPFLGNWLKNRLDKQKGKYASQVADAMSLFPEMRKITHLAYLETKSFSGLKRPSEFLFLTIMACLLFEEKPEKP